MHICTRNCSTFLSQTHTALLTRRSEIISRVHDATPKKNIAV